MCVRTRQSRFITDFRCFGSFSQVFHFSSIKKLQEGIAPLTETWRRRDITFQFVRSTECKTNLHRRKCPVLFTGQSKPNAFDRLSYPRKAFARQYIWRREIRTSDSHWLFVWILNAFFYLCENTVAVTGYTILTLSHTCFYSFKTINLRFFFFAQTKSIFLFYRFMWCRSQSLIAQSDVTRHLFRPLIFTDAL